MYEQTAAPEPRAVLAYGTLRPGWGNHELVEELVASTEPATVEGYGMWVPRHAWFPYARRTEGAILVGDVLRFGEAAWPKALHRMDALEGHPHHYRREVVSTSAGEAWLYVEADSDLTVSSWLLESGDWSDMRDPAPADPVTERSP